MKLLIRFLLFFGFIFIFFSYASLFFSFAKVEFVRILGEEFAIKTQYDSTKGSPTSTLLAPKTKFWISIPKIGAMSSVDSIDPDDPIQEENSLASKRVIHFENSGLPGANGTIIFSAHSLAKTNYPWTNSTYYLGNRLIEGDEIVVGFEKEVYVYRIFSKEKIKSIPDLTPSLLDENLIFLFSSPFAEGPLLQLKAKRV